MGKKIKGKKTLTAVGAVVAAGLAPGLMAASPVNTPIQSLTAAEVVAIDGNTYSFDELFAMQQPDATPQRQRQHATRYGVPRPTTMYGVPRPPRPQPQEQQVNTMLLDTIQEQLMEYCAQLIDADNRGIVILLDSDLSHELGLTQDDLKEMAAEIKRYYGVEVSYHRFYLKGQLNTLRLVSEYIYKLKTKRW